MVPIFGIRPVADSWVDRLQIWVIALFGQLGGLLELELEDTVFDLLGLESLSAGNGSE